MSIFVKKKVTNVRVKSDNHIFFNFTLNQNQQSSVYKLQKYTDIF